MTRAKIVPFGILTIAVMMLIGFGVFTLANKAFESKPQAAASCAETGNEYIVTIKDAQLSINDIHARRCDRLTIINADPTIRLMAFGVHDHHQPYDGVTDRALSQGESLRVVLDQTGTFTFHDHLHDNVVGTFTVE